MLDKAYQKDLDDKLVAEGSATSRSVSPQRKTLRSSTKLTSCERKRLTNAAEIVTNPILNSIEKLLNGKK